MRILVTGATGFLGGHLVAAMNRSFPKLPGSGTIVGRPAILMLPGENPPPTLPLEGATVLRGDVTDPGSLVRAFQGMDAVIHAAGCISYWAGDSARLEAVNRDGVANVVEACIACGVRRLVHVSSVGAVGFRHDGSLADEETPYNWPDSFHYMRTKSAGEAIALRAAASGRIDATVVCPASIMGPGDPVRNSPHNSLYERMFRSRLFVGSFSGGLAVVDVRDLADLVLNALVRGRRGERYLAVGANVRYAEVLRLIAGHTRTRVVPVPVPPAFLIAAGVALEAASRVTGRRPLLTAAYGRLSGWRAWYDAGKSVRELGAVYRPLEETLRDACEDFRKRFLDDRAAAQVPAS